MGGNGNIETGHLGNTGDSWLASAFADSQAASRHCAYVHFRGLGEVVLM